jgi:hypothetical protein
MREREHSHQVVTRRNYDPVMVLIIIETSSSAYPYGMFTRKTAVGEEGDV